MESFTTLESRRQYALPLVLALALLSLCCGLALHSPLKAATVNLSDVAAEAIADVAKSQVDEAASEGSVLLDPTIDLKELEHRLVPLTRPELKKLAGQWLDITRAKTEEVMAAQIAIDRTEGEVADEVTRRVADLVFERNAHFRKFTAVIDAWEKKGGDPDLIAEYRAYHDTVLLDELRTSNAQTVYSEAVRWLTDPAGGIASLKSITWVVTALIGLWLFSKLVRRLALGWLNRLSTLSRLLTNFLAGVVFWVVMLIGLSVALSMLGMDVGPIFALIGGASFILAFAFQDTLGNFASGLMIMINRPFDEGDIVDLGGVVGKVKSVTIVATTIVTADNQVIVLPNRNVWGNLIKNMTANDTRRVDLVFGISYKDSIDDALAIMEEVTKAHPAVLVDPEPVFKVHELAESSVNFICRPWVKTDDYWNVYWDLTLQMKKAFDDKGISIPFPQTDLNIKGLPERFRSA